MCDVNEARKNLELSLGEEGKKQYYELLKKWFLFKDNITKLQFDTAARKLMTNDEQLHNHNNFLLALFTKANMTRVKSSRNASDKGTFEIADFMDYVQPSSPTMMPPDFENRSASSELFLPDSGFITTRIAIHAWENGLDGADENVADVLVQACQMFVKNILSAMVTRKEGYKTRDRFQYAVGLPVADPLLRNTNNIIDQTQELKTELCIEDDSFIPAIKNSIENAEQETAFAYSCSKRKRSDGKLTVKLLYDTLRSNPGVVGLFTMNNINLLKIGLDMEDPN